MSKAPRFIHLRTHTEHSLLEGAVPVKKLVKLCAEAQMPAVAVTDTNNMFAALEFSVTARGFEVGRDSAMDWVLPDPNRHISSRHFEVQFRDGQFWLNDISTNGTFVYGQPMRVSSPRRFPNWNGPSTWPTNPSQAAQSSKGNGPIRRSQISAAGSGKAASTKTRSRISNGSAT